MNSVRKMNGRVLSGLLTNAKIATPPSRHLRRLLSCSPDNLSSFVFSSPEFVAPAAVTLQNSSLFGTSSAVKFLRSSRDNNTEKAKESNKSEAKATTASADEGDSPQAKTAETVSMQEYKNLEEKVAKHKAKESEILDKYRRAIAENENMRKRLTKQIEDAKVFGIQGFCKDLLDVADVLSKAVDAGSALEKRGSNDDMVEGVKLTQTQLMQVFSRHGLTRIAPDAGKDKFDPNVHEALFQVPSADGEENVVVDVQKVGYSLHGRTVRPALVGVSKK